MMTQRVLFRASAIAVASVLINCGGAGVSPCPIDCGPGTVCDPTLMQCVVNRNQFGTGGGLAGVGGGSSGVGGGAATGDGLPCDVERVLNTSCQSCHGATPALGAPFSILTRADLLTPSPINSSQSIGQRSVLRMESAQAPMPPAPAAHVSNADLNAFGTWVNSGMPFSTCTTSGAGGGNGDTGSGGGVSGTGGGVSGTGGGVSGSGGGVSGSGGGVSGTGGGTGSAYCRTCTSDAQCGGTTNFCLDDGSGVTGYCGVQCTSSANCASTATCVSIVDANNNSLGKNCVPSSGVCSGGTGGGSGSGGGGGTAGGSGGTGGGSGSTCTDTWANYASSWFATTCDNCHGSEFATKSGVSGKASSIKSRISSGNMPQNKSLTAAQKTKILNWFTCGMP